MRLSRLSGHRILAAVRLAVPAGRIRSTQCRTRWRSRRLTHTNLPWFGVGTIRLNRTPVAASKKSPAERKPRVICDDCDGQGYTWSERSLLKWEHQTPWFDRVKMSPKPPESWRDLNCVRCVGAGYLDLKSGEPLMDRLIDSAQRSVRRRRVEVRTQRRA